MRKLFITIKLIWQGCTNWLLDLISDIKYKPYFDTRRAICDVCPENSLGICIKCGCVIKAKTMAEDAECPLKKWLTISETLKKNEK
jgi:hypothetical protein